MNDYMQTEGTLYRPPAEANTFLLQVTAGCTHNACRFCNMYRDKPFHLIDEDILRKNLQEEKRVCDIYGRYHKRTFLMDGDVFSLSADKLEEKLEFIRCYMPSIETFSMYAAVRSIKNKSDADLERLKDLGVNDLYIGYETGLDDVLAFMNKGSTLADSIEQADRLHAAGIHHRALFMLGVAGKGRGEESALAAADLVNRTKPDMARFITMTVFPDTPLAEDVAEGRFVEAGELEILMEERTVLENIQLPETHFWASHVLNSIPLMGYIGKDREWMLKRLNRSIEEFDEEKFKKTFKRTHL